MNTFKVSETMCHRNTVIGVEGGVWFGEQVKGKFSAEP